MFPLGPSERQKANEITMMSMTGFPRYRMMCRALRLLLLLAALLVCVSAAGAETEARAGR